ncbi:MAG: hypothetical protein K8J31_19870 [Anaerolineae bacterium]|nr:hypothetical protein [Anaerolineae bacterium]
MIMMGQSELKPLEQRICEVIQAENGKWLTRGQIAHLIGRPGQIHPNDIAALDRLIALDLIEAKQAIRGVVGTRWEYRILVK